MRRQPLFAIGRPGACRARALPPALGLLALGLCALGLLSACAASPYRDRPSDPPFGQSVRRALQAQQLAPAAGAPPAGVPYTELEPALDRQQKAKPPETPPNRSSGHGSGLMGP